jgi:hypothetical protein
MRFEAFEFYPEKEEGYPFWFKIKLLWGVIFVIALGSFLAFQSAITIYLFAGIYLLHLPVVFIAANRVESLKGRIEGRVIIKDESIIIGGKEYELEQIEIIDLYFADYFKKRKIKHYSLIWSDSEEKKSPAAEERKKGLEAFATDNARMAEDIARAKSNFSLLHGNFWLLFEPNLSRGNRNFFKFRYKEEELISFFILDSENHLREFKSQISHLVKEGAISCKDGIRYLEISLYKDIQEFKKKYCQSANQES